MTSPPPAYPGRLVHQIDIPLRWGDMDAMGHVNNTVYFRFMEEARVSWYDQLSVNDRGGLLPPECGPVVIHVACTFKRAVVYPGSIQVRLFITEVGRASLTMRYEMRASYAPDVICAEGTSKGCWIDMKLERSIPLPAVVRAAAK